MTVSSSFGSVLTWFGDHPAWGVFLLSAVANRLTQRKGPDDWTDFAARRPRLAGLFRVLEGFGITPRHLVEGLRMVVTGKPPVDVAKAVTGTDVDTSTPQK